MSTPIILAVFALIGGGVLRFCLQIAGMNKVHAASFLMVAYIVPAIIFAVYILVAGRQFELSPKMTGNAAIVGLLLGATMFAVVSAFLSGGEGTIVFPIAGLGLMVPVLLSVVIFKEALTGARIFGLLLGVTSIIVLSK